jgi:hypothetical protein
LSKLPGVTECDNEKQNFLYPDILKALFQAALADVRELPVIECVSVSQHVLNNNPSDNFDSGTYLSDIDWHVEQSKDSSTSRVLDIVKASHKLTRRQNALEPKSKTVLTGMAFSVCQR